jgi:hypothetical protein
MPDEPSAIPLADVFRAANKLVSVGLIEDYALGGASSRRFTTSNLSRRTMPISSLSPPIKRWPPVCLRFFRICNRRVGVSNANIF